ncbi:28535_t:CDS:1, partial [Dentiscutata erythropus]
RNAFNDNNVHPEEERVENEMENEMEPNGDPLRNVNLPWNKDPL